MCKRTSFYFLLTLLLIFGSTSKIIEASEPYPTFNCDDVNSGCVVEGGECVYIMDVFNGVPAYLNIENDGYGGEDAEGNPISLWGEPHIYGSYYQCTEYVARYYNEQYGTDYTEIKEVNNPVTQGFDGSNICTGYNSGANPGLMIGGECVRTVRVNLEEGDFPQIGDIFRLRNPGHVAIVKEVHESTVTLIEQNFVWNGTYQVNREISIAGNEFFRLPGGENNYEENNSFNNARPVFSDLGGEQSAQNILSYIATSTDVDFYKVHAYAPGGLTVCLESPTNKNYNITLYGLVQNLIDSSTLPANNNDYVHASLPDHVCTFFYIKVYGKNGAHSTTTPYKINLEWVPNIKCYADRSLNCNPPHIPNLRWPSNGMYLPSNNIDFGWSKTQGAQSYWIQVSTQKNFSTIVFENSSITGTSINVTNFHNDGATYYWRVSAQNNEGWGGWSQERTLYNGIGSFSNPPPPPGPSSVKIYEGFWIHSPYTFEYGTYYDAQYRIKNYGNAEVEFQKIGIGGRTAHGQICDLGYFDEDVTLQPGETFHVWRAVNSYGCYNSYGRYRLEPVYQLPDNTWHTFQTNGAYGTGNGRYITLTQPVPEPNFNILTPENGQILNPPDNKVHYTATASHPWGIDWVRFYIGGDGNPGINEPMWQLAPDQYWYYINDEYEEGGQYQADWDMTGIDDQWYRSVFWVKPNGTDQYFPQDGEVLFGVDRTGPQITSLNVDPAGWTNINDYDFWWTGSDPSPASGIDLYQIFTGSGSPQWSNHGTETEWSDQAYRQGTNYFWVRAIDNLDNVGNYSRVPFYYDTTPPANPVSCVETHSVLSGIWQNTSTGPGFNWLDASDAHSGVAGYYYYLGPDPNGTATSYTTNQFSSHDWLEYSGIYYFRIKTRDVAGNTSNWSTQFTYMLDVSAPGLVTNLHCTSHALDQWSNNANLVLQWTAAQDQHSGLGGYSISWDNEPESLPEPAITHTDISHLTLSDVPQQDSLYVHIRTVDAVGNWIDLARHIGPFRIDTTPPENPTSCVELNGAISDEWQNSVASPQFSWLAAVDTLSGVKQYHYYFGSNPSGVSVQTVADTTISASDLAEGVYFLRLKAEDNAGNKADNWSTVFTFKYDATLPELPVYASQPDQWYNENTALDIHFADGWALNTIEYQIDATAPENWQPLSNDGQSPLPAALDHSGNFLTDSWYLLDSDWQAMAEGYHKIYFRITDDAGNERITAEAESFAYNKDITPPNPPQINVAENQWIIGTPPLDIDFSDTWTLDELWYGFDDLDSPSRRYHLLSGNTLTYDWPLNVADWEDLTDGSHHLYLRIIDDAGNIYDTHNDSEAFTFIKDATSPILTHTPIEHRASLSAVTVDLDIQENLAVETAELYYAVNSGAFTELTMALTDGSVTDGTWQATIPAQFMDVTIDYYIRVADHAGNVVWEPETGNHQFKLDTTPPEIVDVYTLANFGDVNQNLNPGQIVTIEAQLDEHNGVGVNSITATIEAYPAGLTETVDLSFYQHGEGSRELYRGQWQAPVTQGKFYISVNTNDALSNAVTENDATRFNTEPFTPSSDILLVMDYHEPDASPMLPYYENSLQHLGHQYDVWETYWRNPPFHELLSNYDNDIVIWTTPGTGLITMEEAQTALRNFIDSGGKLFITGQNIGRELSENGTAYNAFLERYLFADFVSDDVGYTELNGLEGEIINDIPFTISGGDGANNQASPDYLLPIVPAYSFATYDTLYTAGIRSNRGIGRKVAYLSFGFEGISSQVDRNTIMADILDYFSEDDFVKQGQLLLVMDIEYMQYYTHTDSITTALTNLGYSVDVWNVFERGSIELDVMKQYSLVIWDVPYGSNVRGLYNEEVQATLVEYLNSGYSLLMAGGTILDDRTNAGQLPNELLNDYLKVNYNNYFNVPGSVSGIPGEIFSTINYNIIDPNGSGLIANSITPVHSGVAIQQFDYNSSISAVRYLGDYRSVFMSYDLTNIPNPNDRQTALTLLLNYLLPDIVPGFTTSSENLLVLDYEFPNEANAFLDVFQTSFPEPVDVYQIHWHGQPDYDTVFSNYADGTIIWSMPFNGHFDGIRHQNVQQGLMTFLDNGGHLFVTGQNIGFELTQNGTVENEFYNNYLSANYQHDANWYEINGSDITFSLNGGDGVNNQTLPDVVSVNDNESLRGDGGEVEILYRYAEGDENSIAAFGKQNNTYQTTYLAFGFEAINSEVDRTAVMTTVVDYLEQLSPVEDLNISRTGQDVHLAWSPVNRAVSYQVYGGVHPDDMTTLMTSTPGVSWTDASIINTERIYYYQIVAETADGIQSERSSIVGFINYPIETGVNILGIPFTNSMITTINDLVQEIPSCTWVGEWNLSNQLFNTLYPSSPSHVLSNQHPYVIQANTSSSLVITGEYDPDLSTGQYLSTGLNLALIPLSANYTTSAEYGEMNSMVNLVSKWDAGQQEFNLPTVFYSGQWLQPFPIETGQGYFINVTE